MKSNWCEAGRTAQPFDVRLDPERMDLLSPQGFANALHAVCRLKPGAGHLAAPVCSSFVFMSLRLSRLLSICDRLWQLSFRVGILHHGLLSLANPKAHLKGHFKKGTCVGISGLLGQPIEAERGLLGGKTPRAFAMATCYAQEL